MYGDSLESSMAAPFKCPLTNCAEFISSSTLLVHFMKTHHVDNSVDVKEIEENEKITLAVAGDYLKLERNVCLGILAHNLEDDKHSNGLLSRDFKHIEHHLPILIMAYRGNYVKMLTNDSDFIDPDADFITLWLLMPETTPKRKLLATLTVHDEGSKKSLSSLVQVRNAKDSQDIQKVMNNEIDFLTVNSGFLKDISSDGSFLIEISIAENFM